MANPSPYRALPAARRVALLTKIISERKDSRALFIQRLSARGSFRAVTLMQWPPAKLAGEVVRLNVQSAADEIDLLQALYVDVEPAIQTAFLHAAGVKSEGAVIDESLEPPYADAAAVTKAAAAIRAEFGADAEHYLRTIAKYNPAGWPGVEEIVVGFSAA